jgi:hypothetical protein
LHLLEYVAKAVPSLRGPVIHSHTRRPHLLGIEVFLTCVPSLLNIHRVIIILLVSAIINGLHLHGPSVLGTEYGEEVALDVLYPLLLPQVLLYVLYLEARLQVVPFLIRVARRLVHLGLSEYLVLDVFEILMDCIYKH